jgi:PST family polysaccharide transporter
MTRQIASGVGWMVLFKLIDRGLAIVSTLVLARLLVPADFGLVAMAMSVIAILELATAFSFEIALIQKPELQRAHYDTAWTLNAMLAASCAALTALMAYPTALFYGEPRLTLVMLVLGIGWLFSGFENPGTVDFRRQLDFRREFRFLASKRALSFIVTVSLGVALRSYWALVIGSIVGRALGVVLSYLFHDYRPRPCLKAARDLFSFSGWMLANNILSVAQAKIPHFAVGRYLGPQPLGLFTVGAEIGQIPSTDLTAPINRVIFPGFSRLADDAFQLRKTFLDVMAVTTLFALPAAVGIAAVAEPLVLVMLGFKWIEAVPVVQVLALSAAVAVVSSGNGSAYLALGQPRFITLIAAVRLVALVPLALILTSRMGLMGAAYAELVASVLALLASLPVLLRRLQISPLTYVSHVWRPVVASGLMAYAVQSLLPRLPDAGSSLATLPALLASIATGIIVYFAATLLVWLLVGRPYGAEGLVLARLAESIKPAPVTKL